ncbi:MAG TPA: class I SAM-dependent methyltransferase [Anaerolineales bacterium]|nr:class I SAM-dependent methyltransferase [Anaerolineales bacterium]
MEYIHCNLCTSSDSFLLYPSTIEPANNIEDYSAFQCTSTGYGKHHAIVKCKHCGLVYANPRNSSNEIIEKYVKVEDPLYFEERQGRVITFGKHLRPLHRLIGPPAGRSLLDIGAHIGVFVEVANKAGWKATGLEPSHWSVEIARQSGTELIEGTLASSNLPDNHFDVVTLWDVIEHLSDPMTELVHVFRVLKPGGWIVIHTMNIESPFASLMGSKWPWFMEMHLYYFSDRTLRRILEATKFQWKLTQTQGRYLRLGYLVSRFKPYFHQITPVLDKLIRTVHLESLPVAINLGDLITVYAQKPLA